MSYHIDDIFGSLEKSNEPKISNYIKYRGKCKELCELAILSDPSLKIVRGYYYDAMWGKQAHWWTIRQDGTIYDPSKLQFPDQNGDYEEHTGVFNCDQCGVEIVEKDSTIYGNYIFCSGDCVLKYIM